MKQLKYTVQKNEIFENKNKIFLMKPASHQPLMKKNYLTVLLLPASYFQIYSLY